MKQLNELENIRCFNSLLNEKISFSKILIASET